MFALKAHVANICFSSFSGMLQVFRIGVVKVDRDVEHVAMAMHVCFKCIFQMFYLYQTYVARFLSGCCKSRSRCYVYMHVASLFFKCFILLLQVFHLDVAYVCNDFQEFLGVFASVSYACFK